MKSSDHLLTHNGFAFPFNKCPILPLPRFQEGVLQQVHDGGRVSALFAMPQSTASHLLVAVISHDLEGLLAVLATEAAQHFPSLTPACPQVHLFEREIFEQMGIKPRNHPWLKPVRFPQTPGVKRKKNAVGVMDFYRLEGEQIHEVAVGPVHAGVIEPGHFRFQCQGELVHHLEISLGYQHRGIEEHLSGGPWPATLYQMEAAAGDTSIGHTLAYCQNMEALSGVRAPARAQAIRGLALELERLANHIGDLGALAGDVGFLPTATYCGAIRGDLLNMTAVVCGSRLGRGLLLPGGVAFDLDDRLIKTLLSRLKKAQQDVTSAVALLWDSSSVLSRFEGTGRITQAQAEEIGMVGPAVRASGVEQDVRHDHPTGIYQLFQVPMAVLTQGDVHSRAMVRWLEIQRSLAFCQDLLAHLPEGEVLMPLKNLASWHMAISLVEGWRGEICHVACSDAKGKVSRYKIVDPSFHNWFGLALALRGQAISDFPLCNKSFNLSYCGFDL